MRDLKNVSEITLVTFLLFVKTGILEFPHKSDQYYDEDVKQRHFSANL